MSLPNNFVFKFIPIIETLKVLRKLTWKVLRGTGLIGISAFSAGVVTPYYSTFTKKDKWFYVHRIDVNPVKTIQDKYLDFIVKKGRKCWIHFPPRIFFHTKYFILIIKHIYVDDTYGTRKYTYFQNYMNRWIQNC